MTEEELIEYCYILSYRLGLRITYKIGDYMSSPDSSYRHINLIINGESRGGSWMISYGDIKYSGHFYKKIEIMIESINKL